MLGVPQRIILEAVGACFMVVPRSDHKLNFLLGKSNREVPVVNCPLIRSGLTVRRARAKSFSLRLQFSGVYDFVKSRCHVIPVPTQWLYLLNAKRSLKRTMLAASRPKLSFLQVCLPIKRRGVARQTVWTTYATQRHITPRSVATKPRLIGSWRTHISTWNTWAW